MENSYIPSISLGDSDKRPLQEKLTIGSEIGDFIFNHDSIAPRHCSLLLEKGVVSVVDHGSQVGTYINKQKLSSGKKYIINETDKLFIGKVPLEIFWPAEENSSSEDHDFQELLPEREERTEVTGVTKLMGQLNADVEADGPPIFNEQTLTGFRSDVNLEDVELDPNVLELAKKYNNRGVKLRGGSITHSKGEKEKYKTKSASHFILRMFAILFDILICIGILNIFYVFIDFQNFFNSLPSTVGGFLKEPFNMTIGPILNPLLEDGKALNKVLKDITSFQHFSFLISLFLFYFVERIVTTFVFGVSLGQALVGLRGSGPILTKRIMGVLRESLGFFTWPFLIGGLPSLISKRTLKEVLTKTRVETRSALLSTLLILFSGVIVFSFACFTPLIKGGALLAPVAVKENIIKKEPRTFQNKIYSSFFHMEYELNQRFQTLPSFDVFQKGKKRVLSLGLDFFDVENSQSIRIKKLKEFEYKSLYADFLKLNPLSEKRFPQIYSSIHSAGNFNQNFSEYKANTEMLAKETIQIIKESFELSPVNLFQTVIKNGPFIAGHRDFKEKIINLIEKKIETVQVIKWGRTKGILFQHREGSDVSFSFMPIGTLRGSLYSLDINPTDPKYALLTSAIEFEFDKKSQKGQALDPIEKFVEGFKTNAPEDFEVAQLVYERYFMLGKLFMQENNTEGVTALKRNLPKVIEVLQQDKTKHIKLMLNLNELSTALDSLNFQFFNISTTRAI